MKRRELTMYRVLDESQNATVGIKIQSKLTDEDFDGLIPYLSQIQEEVGSLNLLFDLTMLEAESCRRCWNDIVSNLQKFSGIKRMAVEGNNQFLESQSREEGGAFHTEIKFFSLEQNQKAWDWLKG